MNYQKLWVYLFKKAEEKSFGKNGELKTFMEALEFAEARGEFDKYVGLSYLRQTKEQQK